MKLELTENSFSGSQRSYPLDSKSSVRGNSVQVKDNNKIDPFAHLTPVARRFIENNSIASNVKAHSQNPHKRMNSSAIGNKRGQTKITSNRMMNANDTSYSPRKSNLQPSINNYTKFTTTVMGPFRQKVGYSAPEKKRDVGYETAKGPFFSSRANAPAKTSDKYKYSINMLGKAQLPNVSKQRVQIKSNNNRFYYHNKAYPNSLGGPGNVIKTGNSSTKRSNGNKNPNNSFQIMNNYVQTSYGGIGNLNHTQLVNKKGYGSLKYDTKNIYKSKGQTSSDKRKKSPSAERKDPKMGLTTHQLFGKQFGQPVNKRSGSQQRKIVGTNRQNYSPRAVHGNNSPNMMNHTMIGGFVNNSFQIQGSNKQRF